MNITYQVVKTKMPFNLFHRKKPGKEPEAAPTPEPTPEPAPETPVEASPEPAEPTPPVEEQVEQQAPEPESTPEAEPEAPATETEQQPQEQPVEPAVAEPQPEPEQPIVPPAEEQQQEEEPAAIPVEAAKIYLKAMPLKDLADVESVKDAVTNGNIIILRITPLAGKSIEDVKKAVNDLFEFAESVNGDIARLGEERVVICPKTVRIWREKTPAPVAKRDPLPPTTA